MENRPEAMLVQVASQFSSKVEIALNNKSMNAKSIMGVMALGLDSGDEVMVSADGADEAEAMKEIEAYLTQAS
jgi:phosphotransferase system HPr (HPr) family protein